MPPGSPMPESYTPKLISEAAVRPEQASLREEVLKVFPAEGSDHPRYARLRKAFTDPGLAEAYARHSDLPGRFISAELDPWSRSKRGIGRLVDADPPARLGALYRMELDTDEAREELGEAAERVVLASFLAQAGVINWEPPQTSASDARNLWLRGVIPHYHLFVEHLPQAERAVKAGTASDEYLALSEIYLCAAGPGSDYAVVAKKWGLKPGRFGRKRRVTGSLFLFIAVGSALALAIQDRLPLQDRDRPLDPDQLEGYEEPRKMRELL